MFHADKLSSRRTARHTAKHTPDSRTFCSSRWCVCACGVFFYFQGHKNRHDSLEKCTKKWSREERRIERRRSGYGELDADGNVWNGITVTLHKTGVWATWRKRCTFDLCDAITVVQSGLITCFLTPFLLPSSTTSSRLHTQKEEDTYFGVYACHGGKRAERRDAIAKQALPMYCQEKRRRGRAQFENRAEPNSSWGADVDVPAILPLRGRIQRQLGILGFFHWLHPGGVQSAHISIGPAAVK